MVLLSSEFAQAGIGVHHAGLNAQDRKTTEELFLKKTLRIVVATSVSEPSLDKCDITC